MRKSLFRLMTLWIEGIGPFHSEAGLTDLRRVRRRNTGELCANVIDDVEVAIRAVVVPQPNIGTHRLRVRGVHLN